ncbi:hypothetical protein [Caballeronia insecticola]|uniref:hypothetical protein n=1 Tax=Caballeronia insecticola TaxID=758793 RepID=UPI0003A8FF9B|nr:hypothetical protein [Caballeronia insecticola]
MNAHVSLVLIALVSSVAAPAFRAWAASIDVRVPRLAYGVAVIGADNPRRHLLSFRASP